MRKRTITPTKPVLLSLPASSKEDGYRQEAKAIIEKLPALIVSARESSDFAAAGVAIRTCTNALAHSFCSRKDLAPLCVELFAVAAEKCSEPDHLSAILAFICFMHNSYMPGEMWQNFKYQEKVSHLKSRVADVLRCQLLYATTIEEALGVCSKLRSGTFAQYTSGSDELLAVRKIFALVRTSEDLRLIFLKHKEADDYIKYLRSPRSCSRGDENLIRRHTVFVAALDARIERILTDACSAL